MYRNKILVLLGKEDREGVSPEYRKSVLEDNIFDYLNLDYLCDVKIVEDVNQEVDEDYKYILRESDTLTDSTIPPIGEENILEVSELFMKLQKTLVDTSSMDISIIDSETKLRAVVDKLLRDSGVVFYDLETSYTTPYSNDSFIICMSFCDVNVPERVYVLYLEHDNSVFKGKLGTVAEIMKPLFTDPNRGVCAHNTNFDRSYIEAHFGYEVTSISHCTIGMHHLLDITNSHGLEFLSKTYLKIPDMKDKLKEELERIRDLRVQEHKEYAEKKTEELKNQKLKEELKEFKKEASARLKELKKLPTYDHTPVNVLTEYVAIDTYAGAVLYNAFKQRLEERSLYSLYCSYSVVALDYLFRLHRNGQNWNTPLCKFLSDTATKYLKFIEKQLLSFSELGEFRKMEVKITKELKDSIRGHIQIDGILKENEVKLSKDYLYVQTGDGYEFIRDYLESNELEIGELQEFYYRKHYMLSSSKQVGELLYDIFKFPVLVVTEKGAPSTNKKAMEAIEHKLKSGGLNVSQNAVKFGKYLMTYRKLNQTNNTFLKGFPEKLQDDGLIHANFLLHGTKTGRLSCVSADTKIQTEDGECNISDLRFTKYSKSSILTHKGRYKKLLDVIYKGKDFMYEVTLESGKKIQCTKDHKFLTKGGWVKLGGLTEGDQIGTLQV